MNPAALWWSQWLQIIVNLMKVVELGAFTFGAYQFWAGRRERRAADQDAAVRARIDANYQAWQVINSAQGKGGNGGRIEALADLLRNDVSLAGINLDDAWLEGVILPRARLVHASMQRTNLSRAMLAGANLEGADLRHADLVAADLSNANLKRARLDGARLSAATLDGADLTDVQGWNEILSIGHASIEGVRNAPADFVATALNRGAVSSARLATPEDDELAEGFSTTFRIL